MAPRRPRPAALLFAALTALALPAGPARADIITPDSILRPPPGTVGSAPFSAIPSSADLVTDQYAGKGLLFPSPPAPVPGMGPTAAVARIGGVDVWVPAQHTEALASAAGLVDYRNALTVQLVRPGSLAPALARSISVEVVGVFGEQLSAYDAGGHLLGSAWFGGTPGPHGGTLLTVSVPDISWFTVSPPLLPLAGGPFPQIPPWGVAQVSVSPPAAPEPGALALACLGALGLLVGRAKKVLEKG